MVVRFGIIRTGCVLGCIAMAFCIAAAAFSRANRN